MREKPISGHQNAPTATSQVIWSAEARLSSAAGRGLTRVAGKLRYTS